MVERDFSKSTVMVLLVLAIMISLLSTWTLYDQIQNEKVSSPETGTVSQGHISLEIISDSPSEPAPGTQGHIRLDILEG